MQVVCARIIYYACLHESIVELYLAGHACLGSFSSYQAHAATATCSSVCREKTRKQASSFECMHAFHFVMQTFHACADSAKFLNLSACMC